MQFSVLGLMVCLVIAACCVAIGVYGRLAARRGAREHAQWAEMEASLLDLDGELNRVWAQEAGRPRPQ